MKSLIQYINEELDENLFFMLDKWFERNEEEKKTFVELISQCKSNSKISIDKISEIIKGTQFEHDLKEFINFVTNDAKQTTNKDFVYALKNIIETISSNKSCDNKFAGYVEI